MRFASRLTKATDTRSQYVILLHPRQQWLRERAFMLRCSTFSCLEIEVVGKYSNHGCCKWVTVADRRLYPSPTFHAI